MQVELKLSHLRAALVTAGVQDVRYYLNGACIEVGRSGKVWIISTDGHRASVFYAGAQDAKPMQVIIPRGLIERIKPDRRIDDCIVTFDGARITINYCGASYSDYAIDGKFPDWRRIVPRQVSGEACNINVRYIGEYAKVAKLLGRRETDVVVAQNGTSAARVSISGAPAYIGVIMGMRDMDPMCDADVSALINDPHPETTVDVFAPAADLAPVESETVAA
jgi:DNA polymerase-3 subunit beta